MKRQMMLSILSALWLSIALAAQTPLTAEARGYRVALVNSAKPAGPYNARAFTFKLTDKRSHKISYFRIHNVTTDIDRIRIVNGNLVLFGKVGNTADVVTINSLGDTKKSLYFLCYGPELSATGRFLVYKKFYPRFSDLPITSDVLIVYDLEAMHNSRLIESGNPKHLMGDPVGSIVFPEDNVSAKSLHVWVEEPGNRHGILSSAGYLWLKNDTQFLFVDVFREKHWVVLVDVSNPTQPQIRMRDFEIPDALTVSGLGQKDRDVLVKLGPTATTLTLSMP